MIQKILTSLRLLALMLFAPPRSPFLQIQDAAARGNVYTTEYASMYTGQQPVKVDSDKMGGRIRYLVATYTQGAADGTIGDIIYIGRLPMGARRVPGGMCYFSAGNAGATLKVGYVGSDANYQAATSIAAAGSMTLDACFASGGESVMPAETDLIATNAVAAVKAGQKITFHIPYTHD